MRIPCPHCGPRDSREFTCGGDATVSRPAAESTDGDAWCGYVYARANPMGEHEEFWQHTQGCRAWIIVSRDTVTHKIAGARLAARWSGAGSADVDEAAK